MAKKTKNMGANINWSIDINKNS